MRLATRVLAWAATIVAVAPAFAIGGRVEDAAGAPVRGARACVMLAPDVEGVCVVTGDDGRYVLPGVEGAAVRILADGFLSIDVAAVDQIAPIRLQRAASFEVRVIDDATGVAVRDAEVWVLSPDGQRRGPIALGASGRLRMRTFPPGTYRVLVQAPGYLDGTGEELALVAGGTAATEIRLRRDVATAPAK